MKKILALLLAFVTAFAFASCGADAKEAETTIKEEETTPRVELCDDFTVYTKDGEEITLHERIGDKPIIVNLWGVWCNPCVSELPAFQAMFEKYGESIDFMMIHSDGGYKVKDSEIEDLLSANSYTFPVYLDRDYSVSTAYSITGFPTTLLITAEGELLEKHTGMMSAEELEEKILELTTDPAEN